VNAPEAPTAGWTQRALWLWWAVLFCALCVYVVGLGGKNIPTNGDEMVYAHIARLTAATGHWLPLQSDLIDMRNTKPPLLFWQAMVAGDWGQSWTLFRLRLPSVIYTLLITVGLASITFLISQKKQVALAAAAIYLAFFCTFRYGRPYLTSAAETFWLNVPMFVVLWQLLAPQKPSSAPATIRALQPSWPWALAFGLAWGLGAAYKSFALIAPAAAVLWCALLWVKVQDGPRITWQQVFALCLRLGVSVLIGVGIFATWFAIDPDPAAIWREFIVGENAGKMNNPDGYWRTALVGGSSIWVQALAYVQNAGLMAFAVLGLFALGAQWLWQMWPKFAKSSLKIVAAHASPAWSTRQGQLAVHALVLCALVWWLVFAIPSQRSARYVIPAMPVLACLLALYGQRIHRVWMLLCLALIAVALLVTTRLSWVLHDVVGSGTGLLMISSAVAACGAGIIVLGIWHKRWAHWAVPAACIAVYASLNTVLAALDGPAGRFDTAQAQQLQAKRIAVPSGFNGSFERYTFLLPGNAWAPYDANAAASLDTLLASHDAVVWSANSAQDLAPPCGPATCQVLAQRWDFRTRHASGEVRLDNLWHAHQWLLKKEWLVQRNR
jgi:4-amino-4-deoxy-L-arabinose transferase-like glycosyltransferase